ncbi:TrpR YerC/YecD [Candidatus Saccharibacteria bacterium]|nr:MAG: TrpR YerC/YecD [Candidatus Saccharibacteria bacterium]
MTTNPSFTDNDSTRQFVDVLGAIRDEVTMQKFLRDVMTEKEIIEMSARLQAAKMLRDGATYADITTSTKLSSRTVARISDWLRNGAGGYDIALDMINAHHPHVPPARA